MSVVGAIDAYEQQLTMVKESYYFRFVDVAVGGRQDALMLWLSCLFWTLYEWRFVSVGYAMNCFVLHVNVDFVLAPQTTSFL